MGKPASHFELRQRLRSISRVTSLCEILRIFAIGPARGLDSAIFKWRSYDVTMLDMSICIGKRFRAE
jgi:hypothetical protein